MGSQDMSSCQDAKQISRTFSLHIVARFF